jgi:hypothetical protein
VSASPPSPRVAHAVRRLPDDRAHAPGRGHPAADLTLPARAHPAGNADPPNHGSPTHVSRHPRSSHEAPLTRVPTPAASSELAAVLRAAVSQGANETGSARELESLATPTRLLGLALQRLPDLAVSTFIAQTLGGRPGDERVAAVVSQMRSQTAGAIRLCQRALEVHGRDVGYRLGPWDAAILETASALLHLAHRADARHEPCATAVGELREATRAITRAIAACENDRMAVPEHLSEAIGRLLPLFMLAGELQAHADPGRE